MMPRDRLEHAHLALLGLSVGDAFGERFFGDPSTVEPRIRERAIPEAPWSYTDDTEMALAVVDVLARRGCIVEDELARTFANRYLVNPSRGYGAGAQQILGAISRGAPWREAAGAAFDGQGSLGNGGAMRAAPIGAYFADDLDQVVTAARASAVVTHAHLEGQAGAIAVAVAAAVAWGLRRARPQASSAPRVLDARAGEKLLEAVFERTPEGATRDGIDRARTLPFETSPSDAAKQLGSGSSTSSADTVPFALWCAARHLSDYAEAMWTTVAGLGDRDTTCAIAGGVVALAAGRTSIPLAWIEAREPLQFVV